MMPDRRLWIPTLRRAVALAAVSALAGCAVAALPAGAIRVPTDDSLHPPGDNGILCSLIAALRPVEGNLAGDPADAAWAMWLNGADGVPIYVVWPRGFSVRFDPGPTLLDETGTPFASAGGLVSLDQVNEDPTMGTRNRPYRAIGLITGNLSHGERCYTPQ